MKARSWGFLFVLAASLEVLSACQKSGSETTSAPPVPPASMSIAPDSTGVILNESIQFAATAKDALGNVVNRPVTWSTSNAAVATVSIRGTAQGVAPGRAIITASLEGISGRAILDVGIPFVAVSAGESHTCGITVRGVAYCWGYNVSGQLGTGSTNSRVIPAPVVGNLLADSIATASTHTCMLAHDGSAHCWGDNSSGRLGVGTTNGSCYYTSCATEPVTVTGGLALKAIHTGYNFTCGLTTGGQVYCWGNNEFAQLGTGSATILTSNPTPRPVATSQTFVGLSTGREHACAVTTAGAAYCWGIDQTHQLGVGPFKEACFLGPCSTAPTPVAGGLAFTAVAAGSFHTCGITSTGAAYCWGANGAGQLGTDLPLSESCFISQPCSDTPVPVSGGLTFRSITAGDSYTCAITTGGEAYCWGANQSGQLGDGTTSPRNHPVPVTGGLKFTMLSAGYQHTCGVTDIGAAYCWGLNRFLQLGLGETVLIYSSPVPIRVFHPQQ